MSYVTTYVIQNEFGAKFARMRYSPRRPLKVQQRKKLFLISIASSTRLSEPYSGKNLFLMFAYLSLLANKFIP